MTFSADQYIFDRFLFRGTKEDINNLYDEAYEDCFSEPECVDAGIFELELRSENLETWIAKYPLTKSTGFVSSRNMCRMCFFRWNTQLRWLSTIAITENTASAMRNTAMRSVTMTAS